MTYDSSSYEGKLTEIGITLGEPFKRANDHHLLICNHCGYQWTATPISKLQAFKKRGSNGCPECNRRRINECNSVTRFRNLQTVVDRGLMILSGWNGQRVSNRNNTPIMVTVKNSKCGHEFTISAVNLLTHNISCTVCGVEKRSAQLTQTSYNRSEEWRKTASEWKQYKSDVMKLTRINYKSHKHQINPHGFPQGKAGVEGAYHLDHIVPIRYCYKQQIPVELCAHPDNLQLLSWRENVGSRDKLKDVIPLIFNEYINV